MRLNARVFSLAFENPCTLEFMELSFSLARNAATASLPAARSIQYTASPCRLAFAAFLTFSVGPKY
jgi:hypothetical protein